MKKAFIIFATLLLLFSFVACSNQTSKAEDTVGVNFSVPLSGSRGVTDVSSSTSDISADNLEWHYSATPQSTKFTKGATENTKFDSSDDNPLTFENGKLTSPTFELSQGIWSFELWALDKDKVAEAVQKLIDDGNASATSDDVDTSANSPYRVYYGKVEGKLITNANKPNVIEIELSSVITGVKGILKIDPETYIIIDDKGDDDPDNDEKEKINRVIIDGVPYDIPEDGLEIELDPGDHEIILEYVEEVEVDGEPVEIIYGKDDEDIVIESGRETEITGDIKEDTASAQFNGTVVKTYIAEVEIETTVNGEGVQTKTLKFTNNINPQPGDTLIIDCGNSNAIPDEYIYSYYNHDGYIWKVNHDDGCTHVSYTKVNENEGTAFVGGYGTKLEPYQIDSLAKFNDTYLNRTDFAYYQWANAGEVVDCTYLFSSATLKGSFDGNGATFKNTNVPLFKDIIGTSTSISVIKDLNVVAYGISSDSISAVTSSTSTSVTFISVKVLGTLIGNNVVSSYIGNLSSAYEEIIFKNCTSKVELINVDAIGYNTATALGFGGFIGDNATSGNGATVSLVNSEYTGAMYQLDGTSLVYNYLALDASSMQKSDDNDNASALYDSWIYKKGSTVNKEEITTDTTKTTVTPADGAVTADFYYDRLISDGSKDIDITLKDLEVKKNGDGKFVSEIVKKYSALTLNNGEASTTIDKDNAAIKLVDGTTNATFASLDSANDKAEAIIVLQRDKDGNIVQCSYKAIKTR